jgi:hypothetical protein
MIGQRSCPLAHEAQVLGGCVVFARAWAHRISHRWCSVGELAACRGFGITFPVPHDLMVGDGRTHDDICGAYTMRRGCAL